MPSNPHIAQRLLDVIPDMCFVVSTERVVLDCNSCAEGYAGLPEHCLKCSVLRPSHRRLPRPFLSSHEHDSLSAGEYVSRARRAFDRCRALHWKGRAGRGGAHVCVCARHLGVETERARPPPVLQRRPLTRQSDQITGQPGKHDLCQPGVREGVRLCQRRAHRLQSEHPLEPKYPGEFWNRIWKTISAGRVVAG